VGRRQGAPNRKAAWEFIQFAVQARQQAEFCNRLYYGPTNPQAYAHVKPEAARQMSTYPANARQAVTANAEWEGANAAMLQERFHAMAGRLTAALSGATTAAGGARAADQRRAARIAPLDPSSRLARIAIAAPL